MTEITKLDSMYQLSKQYEDALLLVDDDGILTDEALKLLHSYELLKFDYDRAETEKPKGIIVEEIKTLTIKD